MEGESLVRKPIRHSVNRSGTSANAACLCRISEIDVAFSTSTSVKDRKASASPVTVVYACHFGLERGTVENHELSSAPNQLNVREGPLDSGQREGCPDVVVSERQA
jgi:hypothetical protein